MKYWIIITGVFWLIGLAAFLSARFSHSAEEPIKQMLVILFFGGLASVSTLVLLVLGILKLLSHK